MQSKIVYYVATSIDGFIAGSEDDISSFLYEGDGVERYKSDLLEFDTVFMGRRTYEIGFKYGLKPGHKAYPGMKNYIFSSSLQIERYEDGVHVHQLDFKTISEIKKASSKNIYLCGGGALSEWFLEHGLIDEVRLKVNPIILGEGVKLFNSSNQTRRLHLTQHESFEEGMIILNYEVKN